MSHTLPSGEIVLDDGAEENFVNRCLRYRLPQLFPGFTKEQYADMVQVIHVNFLKVNRVKTGNAALVKKFNFTEEQQMLVLQCASDICSAFAGLGLKIEFRGSEEMVLWTNPKPSRRSKK